MHSSACQDLSPLGDSGLLYLLSVRMRRLSATDGHSGRCSLNEAIVGSPPLCCLQYGLVYDDAAVCQFTMWDGWMFLV
jgi:hypothetical protein